MRQLIQFGPFTGIVASLDPEMIPEHSSADMRNVMVEDGRISPRYGYRNLASAQSGYEACYGFDYVQGYNSSGTLKDEYVSAELLSANVPYARLYSASTSSGARTELKDGSTAVNLTVPTYGDQPGIRSFGFNGYGYTVSPNDAPALFRHSLGVTNDLVQMSPPPAPTVAPGVEYFDDPYSDSTSVQSNLKWDNGSALSSSAVAFSSSDLECNGTGGAATSADGILHLKADGAGVPDAPLIETVTVTLDGTNGPGEQDWTYVDRIAIPILGTGIGWDPSGFQVSVQNDAGTTFQGLVTVTGDPASGSYSGYVVLLVDFPNKAVRSDFALIKKIIIGWTRNGNETPGSGSFDNTIDINFIDRGNVDTRARDAGGNPTALTIGYTYYSATTGLESQISPTTTLDLARQVGLDSEGVPPNNQFMYARLKLYLQADAGATFDDYRLYGRRSSDTDWFLIYDSGLSSPTSPNGIIAKGATASTGSNKTLAGVTYNATYSFRLSWTELSTSSVFALGGAVFNNLISACAYKGWVVWGFKGGKSNLQHSTIGNELALYNNSDLTQINPQNTAAPANFTLADNDSDDPIAMFPCGDSLLILGQDGVYAQAGYSPTTMTPPVRLPTALGCAGQYACCLFHDDIGNPAVAYMSKNGEGIYLAQPDLYWLNQTHYKTTELTMEIRGLIQSFLLGGGALLSQVRLGVDWARDALWVVAGNRAMVLRRPSLADSGPQGPERHWELYIYAMASSAVVDYLAFETHHRERWIRSTGEIDENEWNSSSGAYMSGALSDAGSALSPLYFKTRKVALQNRFRVRYARVDRVTLTDLVGLTCVSTRESSTVTTSSGKYFVKFPLFQQGYEHQLTISPQDGGGAISRVQLELEGPLGDKWRE